MSRVGVRHNVGKLADKIKNSMLPLAPSFLAVSKGVNDVHVGRLLGRVESKKHPDPDRHREGDHDTHERDRDRNVVKETYIDREAGAKARSNHATTEA